MKKIIIFILMFLAFGLGNVYAGSVSLPSGREITVTDDIDGFVLTTKTIIITKKVGSYIITYSQTTCSNGHNGELYELSRTPIPGVIVPRNDQRLGGGGPGKCRAKKDDYIGCAIGNITKLNGKALEQPIKNLIVTNKDNEKVIDLFKLPAEEQVCKNLFKIYTEEQEKATNPDDPPKKQTDMRITWTCSNGKGDSECSRPCSLMKYEDPCGERAGECKNDSTLIFDNELTGCGIRKWLCQFEDGKSRMCLKEFNDSCINVDNPETSSGEGCATYRVGYYNDWHDCDANGESWEGIEGGEKLECKQKYEVKEQTYKCGKMVTEEDKPINGEKCTVTYCGNNGAYDTNCNNEILKNSELIYKPSTIIECPSDNTCGDNKKDPGEECDGIDVEPGKECNSNCTYGSDNTCGDGNIDSGEECDDGNSNNNDGCDNNCKKSTTTTTTTTTTTGTTTTTTGTTPTNHCGDGIVNFGETCETDRDCPKPNGKSYTCSNCKCESKTITPTDSCKSPNILDKNLVCCDMESRKYKMINGICCAKEDVDTSGKFCMRSYPDGLTIGSIETLTHDAFANNKDTNTIVIPLQKNRDLAKTGKNVTGFDLTKVEVKNIKDSIYKYNILNLDNYKTGITDSNGLYNNEIRIKNIRSYKPIQTSTGEIILHFIDRSKNKTSTVNPKNIKYNFKKPYIGKIEVKNINAKNHEDEWDGEIKIGNPVNYRLIPKAKTIFSGSTDFIKVENFGNNIFKYSNKKDDLKLYDIVHKKIYTGSLTSTTGALFTLRMDTSSGATKLPEEPGIQIKPMKIAYNFWDRKIEYLLSRNTEVTDTGSIVKGGDPFLGVKVIGGLQGRGKSDFTGQEKNISDLYNFTLRSQIRKNAYVYTKNMTSGKKVNGVYYFSKRDTKISDISDLENNDTIVVENANLIIDEDIDKTIGIIVLKNNYNINNGYKKNSGGGNIYVKPNVKKINAIIYADGAMVSIDKDSEKILNPEAGERTSLLKNQLILNGNLFTRNTIGGALSGGNTSKKNYVLPGGQETKNYILSAQYDLNFLRTGNVGCEDFEGECVIENPFIIKYNPQVQLNPPKLFSVK